MFRKLELLALDCRSYTILHHDLHIYKQISVEWENKKNWILLQKLSCFKTSRMCLTCYRMLKAENPQKVRRTKFHQVYKEACVTAVPSFDLVFLDKGDASASLVDLPHVQLLVLLQGLLELSGGEATRDAALLCFSHAHDSTCSSTALHALCGELTHQ